MLYKCGIDLGGTKTEAILLDEKLNVMERKRISTPQNDYREIINNICSLIEDVSSSFSDYSVGICTPGVISKQTGLIKNSNTQCLIGKPLKEDENRDKRDVENSIIDSKRPATILRLPPVYGPGDYKRRFYAFMRRMVDGRKYFPIGESQAEWRWTHGFIDNIADAIALVATKPIGSKRIFNLGEEDPPLRRAGHRTCQLPSREQAHRDGSRRLVHLARVRP